MLLKRIPAGVYAANCYILMDEETKECAVIDPGGDAEDLTTYIDSIGAKVKYILLTHGHSDHTGAVGALMENYKLPSHISKRDGEFILNGEFMFGPLRYKGQSVTLNMDLQEDNIYKLGNLEIKVVETPGHSPGGVCFLVQDKLFTGDTLFLRSIGRTDLSGGNFETLISSIRNKLLVLDESITVYPGHGPQSSIKYERDNNPFL
ncbi:MBL fold metallo-hydrolase [Clostridium swellfunianum]|uniref:MBL fold metallo-hydrolase n=1 Tax=Clostridium swellfunianum TaxID=1367462 RepID=UPI00202FCECA|nr:MBL fold metallo-hydrolase [Clostridium swellfunianum]MCM0648793.1 MBL fold metallo-hydrolase [Clostridium swellfunianum]